MPGIAGIITKKDSGNEKEIVLTMLNCMLHEEFYTHGIYEKPENGFHIAYCAIEKTFADCMPIFNETKDLILFLTGECYQDKSLIDGLIQRGHDFNPQNASYLIHLYEESGDEIFKTLNGWYNGILLDLRANKAFLFNDRFGIRRIYYHENKDYFAFASEAKSLLKAFPELREISLRSVGEFLTYDCVLENRTYFPKINLLPACSAWKFCNNKIIKKTYLDMSELENQPRLDQEQYIDELASTFKKILPRYFVGDSIGIGLTGGLDTRLIMACYNPKPGELPCYTFGGSYRDIFDVRIAPKVAAACGQTHKILRLYDEKLLKEYPQQVERATYISDGLEGTGKVDVMYFNKMAREIAPIRMTGKYGSQVLKGIFGFEARPPYMHLINEEFKRYFKIALGTAADLQRVHKLTFLLQCGIPWWWNAFVTLESSQIEVRSPFLDNDLIKVLYKAPFLTSNFGAQFELDLIARTKPELMAIPTAGFYGGNKPWPISSIIKSSINTLLYMDKIFIRERLPFNMTNAVARIDSKLISPLHLDRLFLGYADFRRYRIWFRDQLSDYLQDILLSPKMISRPYWDRKSLKKIVIDHIKGRGTYLREIRKVLQIELVHKVLLENS